MEFTKFLRESMTYLFSALEQKISLNQRAKQKQDRDKI